MSSLTLPRDRETVERGCHRPRLAWNVEQDRGDSSPEKRAPIDRGEEDDCRRRRHCKRDRQQNRDPIGAPQSGKYADDSTQEDSDQRYENVERRDRNLETEEEIFDTHSSIA